MKKELKHYEIKGGFAVKDVDSKTRRVKVVLSAFDVMDADRDVIKRGAFAKSIMERGPESSSNRKIAFLRHHDWEQPIGKFISLEETDYQLEAIAELGNSSKGSDALHDYQDGIIREHSIGFNYIPDKMVMHGEGEKAFWEINELKLWEGSAVTFGANEFTPVLDVSKGNRTEILEKLNKEMDGIVNALKNGKGSDDRLYSLEMRLKVIQGKYNSLITNQPVVKPTTEEKKKPSKEEQQKEFYLKSLLKNGKI